MARKWELDLEQVVVDSSEQKALLSPEKDGCQRYRLMTGDYSIAGKEDQIAVERKSVSDLFGSLGGRGGARRTRFYREVRRLASMRHPAILIEGTPLSIITHKAWGKVSWKVVLGTLLSWCSKFRVPVLFADDRDRARLMLLQFLGHANRQEEEGKHDEQWCECGGDEEVGHDGRCEEARNNTDGV